MERIDHAIKAARDCHTKAAWEDFFRRFADLLSSTPQPRLVNEIFKKLADDPQSLYYDPALWGALLSASLTCWNLEVGCEIAKYVQKILNPIVSVPAAQVLLEGGHPAASREHAQRALRGSGLEPKQRLQLEMIVASSFAEEGKVEKAVKILEKVGPFLRASELDISDRANFLTRLGRLYFFIGRYAAAGTAFEESAPLYLSLGEWESAARAFFNVGACHQNSGQGSQSEAFRMVEECRRIAVEHDLKGPLSHCESFYGFESYHSGNFAGARDSFRRALAALPANDKSFRRLHVMSMLSLTYFATGKYAMAKKFAQQTIDLAALDESDRFKARYRALEAEMLWEDGRIPESMEVLRAVIKPMQDNGVHTLEDLSALSRYITQSALCGNAVHLETFKIEEQLKSNKITWLEFEYACALYKANVLDAYESQKLFQDCLDCAKEMRALHYEALSLLGVIRSYLRRGELSDVKRLLPDLEIVVSRLGDSPIKAKILFIYAGIAYQEGDFDKTVKILSSVEKMSAVSFSDLFATQSCLATIHGHSARMHYDWQHDIVARFVRCNFAPTLAMPEPRVFVVSNHYTVNLEKHPALAELLSYLVRRSGFGAKPSEVQTDVWKQSLQAQGWQQKIRNAIMRVRDLFPYTIAPIIIHDDNGIFFFAAAIGIDWSREDHVSLEVQTRRLLAEGPLSSQQIASRMGISLATAKRAIKRLSEHQEVRPEKSGRNIVYRATNGKSIDQGSHQVH